MSIFTNFPKWYGVFVLDCFTARIASNHFFKTVFLLHVFGTINLPLHRFAIHPDLHLLTIFVLSILSVAADPDLQVPAVAVERLIIFSSINLNSHTKILPIIFKNFLSK